MPSPSIPPHGLRRRLPPVLLWVAFWVAALPGLGAPARTISLAEVGAAFPRQSRFVAVTESGVSESWIQLENASDRERSVRLDLTLPLPSPAPQSAAADTRTHHLVLAPRAVEKIPLPPARLAELPYGLHEVGYALEIDGRASPRATDIFALYPRNPRPARGESAMPVGFATGAAPATPRLLELAATLGFEYYRFNAIWSEVQPREGTWRWDRLDATLALLRRHNLRWHVTTTGSARWAAPARFAPPPLEPWRAWITALARRYRDDIQLWEIWNEPNLPFYTGTIEHYDALQRAARDAIKDVAPDIPVTSGGYAGINHGKSKPGAFEAAFRAYPESYDWFAYHMHDTFPNFFNDLRIRLPEIARRVRGAALPGPLPPIAFTETGFDTRHGQRFQAATLVKKMTFAAAIGAKSYTWYNLMDRSGSDAPEKPGQTFGLITNPTGTADFAAIEDGIRPKESFVAAATAIRHLRHARPLETWAQDGRYFAFLFALPRDTCLLVTWTEGDATPDALWVAETGRAQTLATLDLFGNATPLPSAGGKTLVTLAATPCYHLFRNTAAAPRLQGPLVTLPGQISPGAGGRVGIDLRLDNLFPLPLTLTQPVSQTLRPGETAAIPIRRDFAAGSFGDTVCMDIPLVIAAPAWARPLRVPVVFNTLDATRPAGQGFTLRELRHVTNKQDYDPHTLHLLWSGPNDLSVSGTLRLAPTLPAPSASILQIELEVADDTLHAAAPGEPLLDGDALEILWASRAAAPAPAGVSRLAIAADPGGAPRVTADGDAARRALRRVEIRRAPAPNAWESPRTRCTLELDLGAMRLTAADLAGGFPFNLVLHDNDGAGPKSSIALSPVSAAPAPAGFPLLRVRTAR
ncbi:MAG: hypothetical protein LBC18_08290 [Opitutaceae bacterium]|jgi:hypothetical protein|nr:hypothetical protein [Opitutaceae bacterium]